MLFHILNISIFVAFSKILKMHFINKKAIWRVFLSPIMKHLLYKTLPDIQYPLFLNNSAIQADKLVKQKMSAVILPALNSAKTLTLFSIALISMRGFCLKVDGHSQSVLFSHLNTFKATLHSQTKPITDNFIKHLPGSGSLVGYK